MVVYGDERLANIGHMLNNTNLYSAIVLWDEFGFLFRLRLTIRRRTIGDIRCGFRSNCNFLHSSYFAALWVTFDPTL